MSPVRAGRNAPSTRWRDGVRGDPAATAYHVRSTNAWRRELADAVLTPVVRKRLLGLIRDGVPIAKACREVGTSFQAVRGATRRDEAWADVLDAACEAAAPPDTPHGTAAGYRHYRCRCRACHAAHHPARR